VLGARGTCRARRLGAPDQDHLVISDQDEVLAEHRLAERRFEFKVIQAHFQALKARRDRRLQMESDGVFARLPSRTPLLLGSEVDKHALSDYEELA
jgi:hypothetical protein